MKLNRLGTVSWEDSQLLYHAQPRLGREGLNLLSPGSPYFCLGYFQDAEQEVDVEYCREHSIPIFRREVGGGAVYLDGEQLFYQLIIHRDNPLAPASRDAFYRKFLQAPIAAYRALGIPAEYKPVNDILANGRKISGNGVGEIGEYIVFVGNLIVDFDYETMTRVLKVPDEKFRDKIFTTLQSNLTTIRRELGAAPARDELWDLMAAKFSEVLGPMEVEATIDPDWRAETDRLAQTMLRDDWTYRSRRGSGQRAVRIRSGVNVQHKVFKAPGGLIRATVEVEDGVIVSVALSGDFFFYPAEALTDLEAALTGVLLDDVEQTVARFYESRSIESPGITPADIAQTIR
ncbi:MAG: lipoate--protein ligase family protein [Chloroflexi bacterium]|nr:lipoate--protein ligase family protein [Chloroflexota bacterium]